MSKWRRLAIEHIPSCKRTIEEASDLMEMRMNLAWRLAEAYYEDPPANEVIEQIEQIYQYARACRDSTDVGYFFEQFASSSKSMLQDLPNRITLDEFAALEYDLRQNFDSEAEFRDYKKKFWDAKIRRK